MVTQDHKNNGNLKMNKQNRLNANFKLWKDFTFEAAHQLTKVPSGHQCGRLHGHSYKLRIHCKGKLNPNLDWVVDYADIALAARKIVNKLDHSNLNDSFDFETTAENLAYWIGEEISKELPSVYAVELFETPTTSVIYELDN
jgi:6-pyruvoyltetrahydropterin/6-carboxytetrahydropterin synthase